MSDNVISFTSKPFIRARLLRSKSVVHDKGKARAVMSYRSVEGRSFHVEEREGGSYFLAEYRPDGRCADQTHGENQFRIWMEPAVVEIISRRDPNGFLRDVIASEIDEKTIMQKLAQCTPKSKVFGSLDEIIDQIQTSISENRWYDPEFP